MNIYGTIYVYIMYWITTFKYILKLHVEASVYFMYKHYTLSKYSTMKRGWGGGGGSNLPSCTFVL